jgi:hypothetical protein
MKKLLIACSKHKDRFLKKGKAADIYAGTLISYALQYAKENKLEPWFLSAKYGFIRWDQVIETYNQKLSKPYSGQWPDGSGFYVGSKLYFKNSPERFIALVNGTSYGNLASNLLKLVKQKDCIRKTLRVQKIGGKTDALKELLLRKKVTHEQAYQHLVSLFGENEKMRATVKCQLSQTRLGNERGLIFKRDGELCWLEQP